MSDEEQKTVYVGELPSLLKRIEAVLANTAPLSTTTVVVSGSACPSAPLAVTTEPQRVKVRDAAPKRLPCVTLDPAFKLVLSLSAGLTIIMLLASLLLAFFGPDTDAVRNLANLCEHLLSMGFGGIISLVGSKTIAMGKKSR
jgi:hypothetical protein